MAGGRLSRLLMNEEWRGPQLGKVSREEEQNGGLSRTSRDSRLRGAEIMRWHGSKWPI